MACGLKSLPREPRRARKDDMELSARNQLQGKVKSVKSGTIMAEVVIELAGGQEIVAEITKSSVDRLKLQIGDAVAAIVKSTSVMIGK
jgi:molybdopterin-binding protein